MTFDLRLGSCLDPLTGLASLAEKSVDSIVTDPPAGIGFMGQEWDSDKGGSDAWIAWLTDVMTECLRVIKPGGHAVVWALPRTSHWTATAIQRAGWEIRDVHHHIFGTGFPKSLNVSSVMHELLGVTDGEYGTALKPAVEHWIVARRPLTGTVAKNIREHGTGALNIGGCRVAGPQGPDRSLGAPRRSDNLTLNASNPHINPQSPDGRWPAHLSLDEYAARLLDEQAGELTSGAVSAGTRRSGSDGLSFGVTRGNDRPAIESDFGGASRFFYVAKGSRAEKDRGLEGTQRSTGGEATGRVDGSAGTRSPRAGAGRNGGARNIHPTVKSIELMRWLVRLVTPPGGLVLDAFTGSGTTGVACIEEGCRFIGFEIGEDYAEIARARLTAASRQLSLFDAPVAQVAKPRPEQPGLFDSIEAP